MKINQDSTKFEPITITLESMEEVRGLWDLIIFKDSEGTLNRNAHTVGNQISDSFTELDLKHRD